MSPLLRGLIGSLALLAAVSTAAAQAPTQDITTPAGTIVYVEAPPVLDPQGASVYQQRCAVCHGAAADGRGRAARILRVPVPDLTTIALRDGRFDRSHVAQHIRNVDRRSTDPMPCGDRMLHIASNTPSGTFLIVGNLTRYLESLQVQR